MHGAGKIRVDHDGIGSVRTRCRPYAYGAPAFEKDLLDVVVDRCIKVESARFDGGLAIGGLNSGLISAKRGAR